VDEEWPQLSLLLHKWSQWSQLFLSILYTSGTMPVYEYGHAQEMVVNNGEKIVDNVVDYENRNGDLKVKGLVNGHRIDAHGPYSAVLRQIMLENKKMRFRDRYAKDSANYEIGEFSSYQPTVDVMTHSKKKTNRKLTKRRKTKTQTKKRKVSKTRK